MPNKHNLKAPSTSEARQRGHKGGIASAAAKQRRRLLRDCLESILSQEVKNDALAERLEAAGIANSYDYAMSLSLIEKALSGDPRAFEVVRDTLGQKPEQALSLRAPEPVKIEVDYGDG